VICSWSGSASVAIAGRRKTASIDSSAALGDPSLTLGAIRRSGTRTQQCVVAFADLVLEFTTEAALFSSRERNGLNQIGRLEYPEINRIDLEEVPDPASLPAKVGRAALGISLDLLFGGASSVLDTHTVQVTLVTSRGPVSWRRCGDRMSTRACCARRLSRRQQLVRARSRAKNEVHAVLMRRLKGRPPSRGRQRGLLSPMRKQRREPCSRMPLVFVQTL